MACERASSSQAQHALRPAAQQPAPCTPKMHLLHASSPCTPRLAQRPLAARPSCPRSYTLDKICDVRGLRIIVETKADCYLAQRIVEVGGALCGCWVARLLGVVGDVLCGLCG